MKRQQKKRQRRQKEKRHKRELGKLKAVAQKPLSKSKKRKLKRQLSDAFKQMKSKKRRTNKLCLPKREMLDLWQEGVLVSRSRNLYRLKAEPKVGRGVVVLQRDIRGANIGDRVVVRIFDYLKSGEALAKVVAVNDSRSIAEIKEDYLYQEMGVFTTFFPELLTLCETVYAGAEIDESKYLALKHERVDLTSLSTMTIDGASAKDLDDAIDVIKTDSGYRLYVHIADVNHYSRQIPALDYEAYKRGTSVYLVDRVFPMYPPILSNGLCSLHPDVYRLTLTCEMEFDMQGEVLTEKVYESIIKSKRRCTYVEVEQFLHSQTLPDDIAGKPGSEMLGRFQHNCQLYSELHDLLRTKHQRWGQLDFDFPETEFILDEQNNPLAIKLKPRLYAEGIIEMFMIEANQAIARIAKKYGLPIIFRVHDEPDVDRIARLREISRRLDHEKSLKNDHPSPVEMQAFIESIKDKPYSETLQTLALRSLAKACYSGEEGEHYGLATADYCHFTSPIRRYADTYTHFIIKQWLAGAKPNHLQSQFAEEAKVIAHYISEREVIASEAERFSQRAMAVSYYRDKVGEVLVATVSGFSENAMFVRFADGVEGSCLYFKLPGNFRFAEDLFCALDKRSGKRYDMGQQVTVQIVKVNQIRKYIDVELVDENLPARARM